MKISNSVDTVFENHQKCFISMHCNHCNVLAKILSNAQPYSFFDSHAIFHAFQIWFGRFTQITIKRIKLNLKMLLRHKLDFHLRDQTQFAYWKSNQIGLSNSQWRKETSSSKRSGGVGAFWLKFYCSSLLEKYNFISSFFSFPSAVVARQMPFVKIAFYCSRPAGSVLCIIIL